MRAYPTIQHEWFDRVWNRNEEAAIDELLDTNIIGHGLQDGDGNEIRGIDSFKMFYHEFRAAFPDIHIEITHTVSENDMVCANCVVTGTHIGPGFIVPPTRNKIHFTGMCLIRVRDGKIVESWNSFDFLKLMQQIGAVVM